MRSRLRTSARDASPVVVKKLLARWARYGRADDGAVAADGLRELGYADAANDLDMAVRIRAKKRSDLHNRILGEMSPGAMTILRGRMFPNLAAFPQRQAGVMSETGTLVKEAYNRLPELRRALPRPEIRYAVVAVPSRNEGHGELMAWYFPALGGDWGYWNDEVLSALIAAEGKAAVKAWAQWAIGNLRAATKSKP